MPGKSGITASELARNYGVSLNEFTDEVIALLARLDDDPAPLRGHARRREVCAAVSAAMKFALDTSTLTPEERAKLDPLIHEVLLPYWKKHCEADADAAAYITERSGFYLSKTAPGSQVRTALAIVQSLVDELGIPDARKPELMRVLAPSFAHRMISDVHRINDLRTRFGVQLSLLATLCTLLEMSVGYESVLRILRLG
jgi:hypothetical protein